MQAVVLVGGEGTRLRPLTLTQPKPALRLVDRPSIRFMVDWLGRHGVSEVVMACGFRAELLREALGDGAGAGGPSIRYLEEPEPLGTGGPLRLAADEGALAERFLALNGDLLADLDLSALLEAHENAGARATLALHPVADPTAYGLVRRRGGPPRPGADPTSASGEVLEFLEKPTAAQIDTDEVSAGAYVLEREIVELIEPERAVSIEREVFPRLVGRGLYGQRLVGYWMDIGTPDRYLAASWDILEGRVSSDLAERLGDSGIAIADDADIDPSAEVSPPVLIESGVTVGPEATIGRRAVLGAGCDIGRGACITESVLDRDCSIGGGARLEGTIVGPEVEVGARAVVGQGTVIAEGARIDAAVSVAEDARIGPGESVSA